jgi:hypothetical protein
MGKSRLSMSAGHAKPSPAFQAQFEEIERLERALRTGDLTGADAVTALRRIHEIMGWQAGAAAAAETSDTEYVYARSRIA